MKKAYKIFVIGYILLMLCIPSLYGAISPFIPTWYIGDSWNVSIFQRDGSLIRADMDVRNRDFDEFLEPSIYTFKVVDKKVIEGKECFVVEVELDMVNKLLLYYQVNGLNLKYIEKVQIGTGIKITDTGMLKSGIQIEPYISLGLSLTWPDFSKLDPANSPQIISEGESIRQEVTVDGDTLTILWKLGYKESDETYYGTITQEWKMGNKWWSNAEYIRGRDSRVIKKAELVSVVPIKAQVIIKPETFNKNTGIFTAFVTFPEGYDVSTITDAICDGAPIYNTQYEKGKNEMILKFRRDQIIEQPLDTNFVVTGHFGAGMVFEGSDEILKIVE